MPEYIEKGAALATLSKFGITRNMRASKAIAAIHPADVAPVVHGRWGAGDMPTYGGYKCSVCKSNTINFKAKYCPNCGAKMDGKEVKNEI